MKLKQIEIRTPENPNPNCTKVQFYIHDKHKVLFTFEQTDQETDTVTIAGADILEANGLKDSDTMIAYILGITEDGEPFIFEPYQDVLKITEIDVFKFKNVIRK
jgi:hypothetical protein